MSRKDNTTAIRQALSHAHWMAGESPVCHWCQQVLPLHRLTVDHVIPRWQGGPHSPSNAVLACGPCNHTRDGWARFYAGLNAAPPGTWKEERKARREARKIFPMRVNFKGDQWPGSMAGDRSLT